MKYRLIIFDIDGTITTHISSWRYIHEKLGLWDNRAFHYQEKFLAGKISYRRFCELDAAHWKGISDTRIRRIFRSVRYSKNAVKVVEKLKNHGFKIAAISTGLQYIPERLKIEMGFDCCLSNRLLSRNGRLTGKVDIAIPHGAKGRIVKKLIRHFNVRKSEVISVGDTAGDIPLAKNSGFSFAFNSTSKELSRTVKYNCKTKDFNEIYKKICEITW